MLAVAAIGLALVLGVLSGGDFKRLTGLRLPGDLLLIGLFVLQALGRGVVADSFPVLGLWVWGAVSLVLLIMLLMLSSLPGIGVAAAGVAANALVVMLNGGMPAGGGYYGEAELAGALLTRSQFYEAITPATHLPLLGDVLPALGGLASLGDVLLALGIAVFLLHAMLEWHAE